MIMHPAARTALDCLDIASVIVGFIDLHALLPVLLSCSRLRDGVRRILGPDRSLISNRRLFVASVPLMQWAMGMGCGTKGLCNSAAFSGSIDVLKWLREVNYPPYPWDTWTCRRAAAGGHLHVLKWLREENDPPCPWDVETCAYAAMGGELHVLKWLREENDPPCPWDRSTCFSAARAGHLHVLKWLREENDPPCPWDEDTCALAARGSHLHVLKWLREENDPPCPWDAETCQCLVKMYCNTIGGLFQQSI
jgi:hypothetical protein